MRWSIFPNSYRVIEGTKEHADEMVAKGAYVVSPAKNETPEGILIATGSEVNLAVQAQAKLAEEGIDVSVVSNQMKSPLR